MRTVFAIALAACGGPPKHVRAVQLDADALVKRLAGQRDALTSWNVVDADHVPKMQSWISGKRWNGDALVMAKLGAKLRFQALSPAGGDPLADFACDGTRYVFVDHRQNCASTGPCDRAAIARFFHVDLAPDDFIRLALGAPPLLANARATERWDEQRGVERVELASPEGTEKLAIDTTGHRFEVVEAELRDPAGALVWSVHHEHGDAKDAAGATVRVPTTTTFRTRADKSELAIAWGRRAINVDIADAKFVAQPPPGVATCP